ncbi:hypothetical protein BVG19_g1928 [[Candida] boidinii]|nr:hypothetical protein BVG19_g1928 [[Candida] boidinii]OWB51597.1 hypothetical protein B5S27_g3162 [[Candida] boidinii]OWB65663.1 hypothetical protein B5S30_g991 [[Candida] boidinii]
MTTPVTSTSTMIDTTDLDDMQSQIESHASTSSSVISDSEKFPKPLLLSFDAYDTIYINKNSMGYEYNKIFGNYNINLNSEIINNNYYSNFKKLFNDYPNYGKFHGLEVNEFWVKFIKLVIVQSIKKIDLMKIENRYADNKTGITILNQIVTEILHNFAKNDTYKIYDDLIPFLNYLQNDLKLTNNNLIVSSNADLKVTNLIMNEFKLNKFFDKNSIYLSYNLNLNKPNPKFFESIINNELMKHNSLHKNSTTTVGNLTKKDLIDGMWHIGDDYEKDILCCNSVGIKGILIDRKIKNPNYFKKFYDINKNLKFVKVSNLLTLKKLFKL